jgi:hypothetical protein
MTVHIEKEDGFEEEEEEEEDEEESCEEISEDDHVVLKKNPIVPKNFEYIPKSMIEKEMKNIINDIKNLTFLDEDDATLMLIKYNWKKDKLMEKYLDNPSQILLESGVVENKKEIDLNNNSEINKDCFICTESFSVVKRLLLSLTIFL